METHYFFCYFLYIGVIAHNRLPVAGILPLWERIVTLITKRHQSLHQHRGAEEMSTMGFMHQSIQCAFEQ